MITYEIELPPSGNKVGFNLLDDEDIIIPYITDTIPNSPVGHQLPSQAKLDVWIITINGKETISDQGSLDELNHHKNPRRNPRSGLVYAEGRANRENILKKFAPDLIKSYL